LHEFLVVEAHFGLRTAAESRPQATATQLSQALTFAVSLQQRKFNVLSQKWVGLAAES
jgi:hypothetical protein